MNDSKTRYCFHAEWFDIHAQLTRHYELFFYPADNTVEMVQLFVFCSS
jgi:nucleoside-diphosphate kinase